MTNKRWNSRWKIGAFLFLGLAGCGGPRDKDLSYGSNLWRIYDDRSRYGFFGDRALPRAPFLDLRLERGGWRVITAKGSAPLPGKSPESRPVDPETGVSGFGLEVGRDRVSLKTPAGSWSSALPVAGWSGEPGKGIFCLAGGTPALSDGGPDLYLGSPGRSGKIKWEKISMSLYVPGATRILKMTPYRTGLAVATDKGLALSRGAPFRLWRVLGKSSGLPEGVPSGLACEGGDIWVLFPDRLCRSSGELKVLLDQGFPPS